MRSTGDASRAAVSHTVKNTPDMAPKKYLFFSGRVHCCNSAVRLVLRILRMATDDGLKIVSGGQIGADIAALRAARRLGLATGGFAPAGFMTAHGPNPQLAEFGLAPVRGGSLAQQYVRRSTMNVDAADATLAIRLEASRGTDCTIGYAVCGRWAACADLAPGVAAEPATAHRPVLVVQTLCESAAAPAIREFLHRRRVRTLNVCGHRAYDRVPNYESAVEHLLFRALSEYA